ncbi:MAG: PGPGW domain-containing protein [Terriglobia bacterium]
MARIARTIGGFGLIALGIVGLFLPVLQGIAFIVLGLLLLGREYHWARRLLDWVRRKRGQPQGSSAGPTS